jgi:hypothetical protein
VLSRENYEIVMDRGRPLVDRMTAFANRANWLRLLGSARYTDQINNMLSRFGKLGVVEQLPGPGDPEFPSVMQVENLPQAAHALLSAPEQASEKADQVDIEDIAKVHRYPHGLR